MAPCAFSLKGLPNWPLPASSLLLLAPASAVPGGSRTGETPRSADNDNNNRRRKRPWLLCSPVKKALLLLCSSALAAAFSAVGGLFLRACARETGSDARLTFVTPPLAPTRVVRSRVARRASGEPQNFHFRYTKGTGRTNFGTEGQLPIELGPLPALGGDGPSTYLSDPDRIVAASFPWDSSGGGGGVEIRGPGRYSLKLPPLELVTLRWQADVAFAAAFDAEKRTLSIQSEGVNLDLGGSPLEAAFKDSFDMVVRGGVADISEGGKGELTLNVRMDIQGKMPWPLSEVLPEEAIRQAAAEVCRLTLGFVMEDARKSIAEDYRLWQETQQLPQNAE